jgi:hypothetical protein
MLLIVWWVQPAWAQLHQPAAEPTLKRNREGFERPANPSFHFLTLPARLL